MKSLELARNDELFVKISDLLRKSRLEVISVVNKTMVLTYFEIGKLIIEEEQNGSDRAAYGKRVIEFLSDKLIKRFGKGFSQTNLKQMRSFYLIYSKGQTPSDEFDLSWSHYLKLMRIEDENERKFYEIESVKNNWSLRELQRQYDSALYTRLKLCLNQDKVIKLSKQGHIIEQPSDVIKDPCILEFIGLPERDYYTENDLEQRLIEKLENFLLELGNGFTFVARQKRISFEEKNFFIDLVFYNRILRCFVLIDLKIGELKHQDIGQMQMYVNYYDREMILPEENKTVGLILCQNKSKSVVEYTLPEDNKTIFASIYKTVFPGKSELKKLLGEKTLHLNNL